MNILRKAGPNVLVGLVGLIVASSVLAQAPRSTIDAPVSPGQPQYRDPRTNQVWTPNNPADRAFDPLAQATVVSGVVQQQPAITPMGSVPITAGPTVPIVNMDGATLSAVPAQRWQVVLYLNNNSASAVAPVINCQFMNSSQLVESTNAVAAGGARQGRGLYRLWSQDHPVCRSCPVQRAIT
jgi:hypothetical protein